MSLIREALKDTPLGFFLLDDTKPFQDYSGYNRVATSGGTPSTIHMPLVKNANYAPVFTNGVNGVYTVPVFSQGKESSSFTLEAWAHPVKVASSSGVEQQILGNLNNMDGLVIIGSFVYFATRYLTAPDAVASYELQQDQSCYLVGVHTAEKNMLYVNGELVDEVSLTDAQKADQFKATDNNLYTGTTTANAVSSLAINGLGMYGYALSVEAIKRHYEAGLNTVTPDDVASAFGGNRIKTSIENSNTFVVQKWNSTEDWETGVLKNTSIVDEELSPNFIGDTSVPGYWHTAVSLEVAAESATSIYGVTLQWDGIGAVVETSINGTTWSLASRGERISTIAANTTSVGKDLQIRVKFNGGVPNDESYLNSLNLVGFLSSTTPVVAGRTLATNAGSQQREYYPAQMHSDWGIQHSATTHTTTISPDTLEAQPLRTLEMWIKRTSSGSNPTTNITSDAIYQNGSISTATINTGRWSLMHIVATTDIVAPVIITGVAQIGSITVYDRALTATEIANIALMYESNNVAQVVESNAISVTEPAEPAKIYAHDWSITSAT